MEKDPGREKTAESLLKATARILGLVLGVGLAAGLARRIWGKSKEEKKEIGFPPMDQHYPGEKSDRGDY